MKLSHSGQGALEAVLTLPVLILLATGLIWTFYRSLIFYWSDYQAHEALICSQSESSSLCQKELEARLKKLLIANVSYKAHVRKEWSQHRVQITIELTPPLHIEKAL